MDFPTETRVLGLAAIALALFGAFAPYRWHEMPPAVTNIALLLAGLCALWALWLILPKRWFTTSRRVNSYLIVAAIFGICSVGALVGYWLDWRRGPIEWNFEWPISISQAGSGWIMGGFQIEGTNASDDPVPIKDAYVRSNITAQIIPLVIGVPGGDLPASQAVIKPRATFRLFGRFPPGGGTVPLDRFMQECGRFSFVFEYEDNRTFKKDFSENDVDAMVSKLEKSSRANKLDEGPGVVRKQD
jgi:hypothetical protein